MARERTGELKAVTDAAGYAGVALIAYHFVGVLGAGAALAMFSLLATGALQSGGGDGD